MERARASTRPGINLTKYGNVSVPLEGWPNCELTPLKVKQKMGMSTILVDKENVVLFRLLMMNSLQVEPLPIPTSHV